MRVYACRWVTRVGLYKHIVFYINDKLKAQMFPLPACDQCTIKQYFPNAINMEGNKVNSRLSWA